MDQSSTSLPSPTTSHEDDWFPNPGPQSRFLGLRCFEALYGGAAGGGKSDALLVDAIRGLGKGYGKNYAALLLRREFPDLEMSLMRRAHALYPRMGGTWRGDTKTWTFPAGETVRFGHAQYELDVHQYQGAEFQFVGFDELTSFTAYQYTYLISRLRSSSGVPCRLRAATNPGGPGHEWVFKRFGYWLDPDASPHASPGEVLYLGRDDEGNEQIVPRDTPGAIGRTFVPALLADNPYLNDDGKYGRALDELDPVTREQLKAGNWLVKPAAGRYFKREWVTFVDEAPRDVICRVRAWDLAGTEKKDGKSDPDWTVGLLMSMTADHIVIEDEIRFRGNPGEVKRRLLDTAEMDGQRVVVRIPQDPGQAGKSQADDFIKELTGYRIIAKPVTGDKVQRFGPFSSQAERKGRVVLVRAPWNAGYISELEQFPTKGIKDDRVDATSDGLATLVTDAPVKLPSKQPRAPSSRWSSMTGRGFG